MRDSTRTLSCRGSPPRITFPSRGRSGTARLRLSTLSPLLPRRCRMKMPARAAESDKNNNGGEGDEGEKEGDEPEATPATNEGVVTVPFDLLRDIESRAARRALRRRAEQEAEELEQDVLPTDPTAQTRVFWMRACAGEFRRSAAGPRTAWTASRTAKCALHFQRSGAEPQRARWKLLPRYHSLRQFVPYYLRICTIYTPCVAMMIFMGERITALMSMSFLGIVVFGFIFNPR
mmetsp:Transcript_7563/g.34263  ORF Transcript_7563/g.34263 Transcript_7563/m.34263 type:complete len:233 (+) Transcript_7563:208-906(+)